MINGAWWVPVAAGFEDAVNPCILMSATFLLMLALWFHAKGIAGRKYLIVFVVTYVFLAWVFNAGLGQGFLYAPQTRRCIALIYLGLGIFSILGSYVFAKSWWAKDKEGAIQRVFVKGKPSVVIQWVVTIALAVILAVLSSVWPMNVNMTVIANSMLLPGQWQGALMAISLYTCVASLLLYVIGISVPSLLSRIGLFYAVASAMLMSAGVGAIYFFK